VAVRLEKSVGGVLDERGVRYRVLSIGTVKMATGMEGAWQIAGAPAEDLVRELGRIEGIQDVRIERWTGEEK